MFRSLTEISLILRQWRNFGSGRPLAKSTNASQEVDIKSNHTEPLENRLFVISLERISIEITLLAARRQKQKCPDVKIEHVWKFN